MSNIHPLTFGVSVEQGVGETRAVVGESVPKVEVRDLGQSGQHGVAQAGVGRTKVELDSGDMAKRRQEFSGPGSPDLGGRPAGEKRYEGPIGLALDLFAFASGRPSAEEGASEAVRLRRAGQATLASLGLAALWGLAAASTEPALAVANVLKMPMVVMLSLGAALPAGVVAWRLSDTPGRASDLLVSGAAANLAATLVMAATAPLVALYHHSSASFGAGLAMGSAGLGVLLGLLTLKRGIRLRAPEQTLSGRRLPSFILAICWIGALVQFIHVASPIIPEVTVFDGGVDAILGR